MRKDVRRFSVCERRFRQGGRRRASLSRRSPVGVHFLHCHAPHVKNFLPEWHKKTFWGKTHANAYTGSSRIFNSLLPDPPATTMTAFANQPALDQRGGPPAKFASNFAWSNKGKGPHGSCPLYLVKRYFSAGADYFWNAARRSVIGGREFRPRLVCGSPTLCRAVMEHSKNETFRAVTFLL